MYARTCKGCGNEFTTTVYRQKYCVKDCGKSITRNRARAEMRLHNDIEFIGVDGEGVDRPDGKHEYVMLSVGDKTLWRDGIELPLADILSFLYECYTDTPNAAFVGFFLGYDFIQWQKLLPEREARLLLTNEGIAERKSRNNARANPYPDAVVWEGWEIDIMAGRRFKLRPHVHHCSEWTGLCRNRTCRKVMNDVNRIPYRSNGPGVVDVYPTGNEPALSEHTEYTGNAASYWESFADYRKHGVGQGSRKVKAYGWMYICDTGPFWQTSFLNVINPKAWDGHPVCTDEEYATVTRGKADRGTVAPYGNTEYYSDMQLYNVLENEILARVTTRLNQGFMNDQIPIKIPKTDWYGPGRAAQLWMDQLHALCANPSAVESNRTRARNPNLLSSTDRHNETGLLNADVYMSMPSWFYDAAQASYYGGWFEQFMHGHVGNVWEYDINSAYPFIIASLPCLHTTGNHNGQYSQGKGASYPTVSGSYTLLYATVTGSNPYIGAMPYRSKQGLISRPNITKGWYWLHELEAAKNALLVDDIQVEEWVSYRSCDCTPPFNPPSIGISRLYQARLDFGKNTPQGKSAKLVYNSAYGKTAQSIGTPKYSNPVYASLITAGCRTLILEAIATHPIGASAVSMVATDGVYFISPHPSLPLSKTELGMWDETCKQGMTQLMPGVYWDDSTRALLADGKNPKLKSRGVNARDLASQIEQLDYLFADAHQSLKNGGEYSWPEIEFTVGFLLDSAKLALQRGKWDTAGRVTHNAKRRISANPSSKRHPRAYRDDDSHGITRTYPYREYEPLASTPYSESFGYLSGDELGTLFAGSVGRDENDGMQYFRDLIKGEL